MADELKPCPFCGGKAKLITWHEHTEARHIKCTKCGAMSDGHFERIFAYKEWNARSNDWQPIETAPRDGTEIITVVKGFVPTIGWYDGNEWLNHALLYDAVSSFLVDCDDIRYNPTHWMPLPEPPKD